MNHLGTRLRELRLQAGVSQKVLAAHLGVDHSYISKIEHNFLGYKPSASFLVRLAEYLGADALELLVHAEQVDTKTVLKALQQTPELWIIIKGISDGAISRDRVQAWLKEGRSAS